MKEFPTKDGVKECLLDSWTEFHDLVKNVFATAPALVYRGQADCEWPVESTLDRHEKKFPKRLNRAGDVPKFFDCPPFSEEEHLNAFRRAIRGRRGPNLPEMSDDECWSLGQHHGLVTPLLDWTRSPYVALFFAFEDEDRSLLSNTVAPPEYRVVYALSTSTIEQGTGDDGSSVRLVSPATDTNYRLVSQGGLHLCMPRRTDLVSYVKDRFSGEERGATLTKVKIPNEDRSGCLVALNKMNINHMALFPDLDGAARHVNSLWQAGHEDSIAYV